MTYSHPRSRRIARALRPRPGVGSLAVVALGAALFTSASIATADDYGTFRVSSLSAGCHLFGAGNNSPGQLGGGSANYIQPGPLQFGGPPPEAMSSAASLANPIAFLNPGEAISAVSPVTSTFILTSDGRVLGSGRNAVGQLGQGDFDQRVSPVVFPLPAGETAADVVKDVWGKVVYVRTASGKVFGAGYNLHGQLGDGTRSEAGWNADYTVYTPAGKSTPVQLQLPAGERAAEVVPAPDGSAVFVLTESGKVYGVGMNDQGQLGTSAPDATVTYMAYNPDTGLSDIPTVQEGSEHQALPVLFELPAGKIAKEIVPGSGWTMVQTTDGEVYGAGRNLDGRLGVDTAGARQRTPVRFPLPAGVTAEEIYVGTAVPNFSNFEATTTTDDEGTTYVITEDGRMFGAGSNRHGQLGNAGAADLQTAPVEFTLPAGEKVHEWYIGAVLPYGKTGTVYEGEAYFAEYGAEPVSVYVLTESGRVFGAGDNRWGQLGNGTFTGTVGTAPVEFATPAGDPIVDFVTGADESFVSFSQNEGYPPYASHGILAAARTAAGRVLGAGNNKDGQLGIGTLGGDGTGSRFGTFGHATPTPFLLPSGEVAVDFTASSNGITVITATGRVYGAGDNSSGELGNGTYTTTYDPITYEQRSPGVPTPTLFDLPGVSLPPLARATAIGASAPWRAHWAIRRKAWSIGSGASPSPYQFVLACPASMSLGEIVFDDVNDNGRKDAGEAGVANVTVRIYRAGESVALQTTTTDATGHYLFNDLTPGEYVVEIVLPTGFRSSTDPTTGATPDNDVLLDDNGVQAGAGGTVRSKTITLIDLGERTLEPPAGTLANRAVDADSNITIGFGINRIPPPIAPAPTPTQAGEQTPNAVPVPVGDRTTLAIGKTALRSRVPQGQVVSYRISVRNTGRNSARGVVVCDRLPAGLTLVTTKAENGRIRVAKGQVCATWGTLAPRKGRTVTLVTRVARQATPGRLTNTASARGANTSPVSARAVIFVTSATGGALPAVTG